MPQSEPPSANIQPAAVAAQPVAAEQAASAAAQPQVVDGSADGKVPDGVIEGPMADDVDLTPLGAVEVQVDHAADANGSPAPIPQGVDPRAELVAGLEGHIRELLSSLNVAYEEINRLRSGDLGSANAEVGRLNEQLETMQAELNAANTQVAELAQQLATALPAAERLTIVEANLASARAELEALKQGAAQAQAECKAAAERYIEETRAKLVQGSEEAIAKVINEKNDKIATLNKRIKDLEQQSVPAAAGGSDPALQGKLNEAQAALQQALDEKQALQDRLDLAAKFASAVAPTSQAELDKLKADLQRALADKSAAERKSEENHRLSTAALDVKQNELNEAKSEKLIAETEVTRLTQELEQARAGKRRPTFTVKRVAAVLLLLVVAMGIIFKNNILGMIGFGPKPELVPASAEVLQKFFLQDNPTCLKGKAERPVGDTLGFVCKTEPKVDEECTDVSECAIALPSKFSKPGAYLLTAEVMRAYRMSGDDPTCVTSAQLLEKYQKVSGNVVTIDNCPGLPEIPPAYNAVRQCEDLSRLCLIVP